MKAKRKYREFISTDPHVLHVGDKNDFFRDKFDLSYDVTFVRRLISIISE